MQNTTISTAQNMNKQELRELLTANGIDYMQLHTRQMLLQMYKDHLNDENNYTNEIATADRSGFTWLQAHESNKIDIYVYFHKESKKEFISFAQLHEFSKSLCKDLPNPKRYYSTFLVFEELTKNQIELLSIMPYVSKIEDKNKCHNIYIN